MISNSEYTRLPAMAAIECEIHGDLVNMMEDPLMGLIHNILFHPLYIEQAEFLMTRDIYSWQI
jgi:hypothetical protein